MNNNLIKVSGAIGLIILQKDNKKVYIFFDDHANKNYCQDNNIFINDIFEIITKSNNDTIILLEEPFVDNLSNIKFLWNDTPHIIMFRKFYKKIINQCINKKICNTYPVDIRLCIFDISIDELFDNIDNINYFKDFDISVKEYFKYILYLFNFDILDQNNTSDKNIFFIKKVFDRFVNTLYYQKLLKEFKIFYDKFIKNNINIKIYDFIKRYQKYSLTNIKGYPFINENYEDFQDQYDKLINGIMEYYAFILITCLEYKNLILYTGFYHAINLSWIMEKYYNYKKIHSVGKTEFIDLLNNKNNCLTIPKNIF